MEDHPWPPRGRKDAPGVHDFSVQSFRRGFAISWRDQSQQRHRKPLVSTTRAGAEAEARQEWWRLQSERPWFVGDIVEAYIADRASEGIASTQRQRDAWKAMAPFWAGTLPSVVDYEMGRDYAAWRNRSPGTVKTELNMLSVALRWASKRKLIDAAPTIWRPPADVAKVKHLERDEFERFFAAAHTSYVRLYIQLGLYTGARPTALLELTWDRVDLQRLQIDLNPAGRTQTKKRRPVLPISDGALAVLKDAYERRESRFVIHRAGKPISSLKKAFQAASRRSGVHATPYTLRHTAAVWAAENGVPMAQLAQFLGHVDSRTTERHYARYSPGHLRNVANSICRDGAGGDPWSHV